MAINPTCDMCKKELVDFGGLLFSPSEISEGKKEGVAAVVSKVEKYHICKMCWIKVRKMVG